MKKLLFLAIFSCTFLCLEAADDMTLTPDEQTFYEKLSAGPKAEFMKMKHRQRAMCMQLGGSLPNDRSVEIVVKMNSKP